MAALTMSFDAQGCRYAAAVQTNGYRVEMITESNIKQMMIPLVRQWITKVGGGKGPEHIYYFRDGVSEGQYAQVLNQEVAHMKELMTEAFGPSAAAVSLSLFSNMQPADTFFRSSTPLQSALSVIIFVSSPRIMMLRLATRMQTLFQVLL